MDRSFSTSSLTTVLDKGNDLKKVQSLMEHSHIRTTEACLDSTDDRKVEAIRRPKLGDDAIQKRGDCPENSFLKSTGRHFGKTCFISNGSQ
jgi:hypothetical protein